MHTRVKHHVNYFKYLASLKPQRRRLALAASSRNEITALTELLYNVCKNPSIQVGPVHRKKLRRYKQSLIGLFRTRSAAKRRKTLQRGGLLGAILAPVAAGFITAFGSHLFDKALQE